MSEQPEPVPGLRGKQSHRDMALIVAAIVEAETGGRTLAMSMLEVLEKVRREAQKPVEVTEQSLADAQHAKEALSQLFEQGVRKGASDAVEWLTTQADRYEGSTYAALKRIAGEFSVAMRVECEYCKAARLGNATLARNCTCGASFQDGLSVYEKRIEAACQAICPDGRDVFMRLLKKGFWSGQAMQRVLTEILEKEPV